MKIITPLIFMRFLARIVQLLNFKSMSVTPSHFWVALRKLTIIALVFLFMVAQIPLAFAEEGALGGKEGVVSVDSGSIDSSSQTPSSPPESSDTSMAEPSPMDDVKNKEKDTVGDSVKKNEETKSDDNVAAPEAASAVTSSQPDVNSANVATGVTQRLTDVDQNSGAYIHDYPIAVPPGRNNLQPDFKISYNSQGNEDVNIIGYGWSLSIPTISRINKNGTDKLYTRSDFVSSMSGELVDVGSGNFAAKVESGEFLKYAFIDNAWVVTDKAGTVYSFGATSQARQDNTLDTTQVYKWMLEEVRDTNNNYVRYEYFKDAGQIYPSRIIYTGNGTTDGIFEVNFIRGTRVDAVKSYKTGFLVQSNFRIVEINTEVNDSWVRKYTLSYSTGDNTVRSMLTSITESGRDEAGVITTLPATSFTYQTATPGWELDNSSYNAPLNFNPDNSNFIDVNSDSYLDIMNPSWDGSTTQFIDQTFVNSFNSAWTEFPVLASPIKFIVYPALEGGQGGNTGVRVVDVNGDQYPDLVQGFDKEVTPDVYDAYLNNAGTGWTHSLGWAPSLPMVRQGVSYDYGGRVLDLNGDGLPDWTSQNGNDEFTQINTGSNFSVPTVSWNTPRNWEFRLSREVDINNDGLVDMMYSWWNNLLGMSEDTAYLNNGLGQWVSDSALKTPVQFGNNQDYGVRFFDVNGDGLQDTVVSPEGLISQTAYINKGNGWIEKTQWNLPNAVRMTHQAIHSGDFNQDGLLDFMKVNTNPGVPEDVWLHSGVEPDLLSRITTPQGGYTDITYQKTARYKDSAGNLLNPNLPMNLTTVKSITTNDGAGTSITFTYSYEGGKYYYNGPFDRKLSGFAKIKKIDAVGNTTTFYYHQGDGSDVAMGEYMDEGAKIGRVFRTESRNSSGAVYVQTVSKWDSYDLGGGRKYIRLTQVVTSTFDGDASHKDSAESYSYINGNGNLSQKVQWGEVVANTDGTFTDIGNDSYTTDYSYASNPGGTIIGLASQILVTDQTGAKVKETRIYYDTQALGLVLKGNATKQEEWRVGTAYINTQKTYNATYGTVTTETDARGKVTQYTNDAYNLYPATVLNPLNQATQLSYDYSSGQVKQTIDANSKVFQNVYDGLDRLVEEKQPDFLTPSALVSKTQYVYTDISGGVSVKKGEYLDAVNSIESYTYFDGLGRKIQERTEAEGSNFVVTDTIYNSQGLVYKESLPYFSIGGGKTSATTTPELLVAYSYDPIWRVSNVVNAVGNTSTNFSDWKVTVTDAKGVPKDLYNDAYGRLARVDEHNGAATYSTTYQYNYHSNLTKITDALGNIRNFTFDGLGRRLTAQDLHAPADTTFGTWTYVYDDAGNINQTINPNNQTINATFDDINRQLTEDFVGTTGIELAYTYDSCTNGVGRVCSAAVTGAITSTYQYNPVGAISTEVRTIDGVNYQTSYTYDRQGTLLTVKNPDNSEFRYNVNNAGLLESTERKESTDATWQPVVSNFDYNSQRNVTQQVNANGTITTNTYDPTKLYRLSRKVTTGPGGAGQTTTTVSIAASAGDGSIYHNASNSWDTAHDAITGSTAAGTATTFKVNTGKFNNTRFNIERGFVPFDTSSIPDAAQITDVKLKLFVESKLNNDNDGSDWATVVQGLQPSTTALTTADYDLAGTINTPTEGIDATERKDISSVTTGQYLVFTLNAVGRSWISKTGASKLALREGHDVVDSSFVGSSGQYNQLVLRASEYAGTASDPILEVTYTEGIPAPTVIQDVSYVYDSVGNITQITDVSGTATAKVVSYTYDDLHRLLSATTASVASGQQMYIESYTYDAIGNRLTKTNGSTVTYVYAGNSGSSMANPHAATSIGGVAIAYDANGNMTSDGATNYTWSYDNRLASSVVGGVTTTYLYDHTDQRIKQSSGATFTRYPSKLYNVDNAGKAVKHLPAGDNLSLTIENSGVTAVMFYQHIDHLGSQGATTNNIGQLVELEDYFPFGNMRINTQYTGYKEQRKYIGQEYDSGTGLSYLNARYYMGAYGRFLSQDPVFLALGDERQIKSITDQDQKLLLTDPQNLNAFAYGRNNPLRYKDPQGEFIDIALDVGFIAYDLYKIGKGLHEGKGFSGVKNEFANLGLDIAGAALPGVTGLGVAARAAGKADNVAHAASSAKIVKSAEQWSKTSFDAAKQQAAKLKGVTNPTIARYVKKTYQFTDTIIGGTSAAAKYTYETGIKVGESDHIKRNWDTIRGGINLLRRENPTGKELNRVKSIIKQAWKVNYR